MSAQEEPIIVERIHDDALVVRGGANRPADIQRGIGTHPSGVTGVSVQSAAGVSLAELAAGIPHRLVGVTTVKEVRLSGGDVIRTSGRTPYHATLTGLSPEQISNLLIPTISNPIIER
ncbi:flavoredoxin [Argonema antarcticum]|uniref:flavoredoxin n=1 Tax=Argonema antarcticum TaxID=2942763 RepID=UPI002012DA33|nr:flavoredoxin [Argonema antarcticum]MCL1472132.1 flavoredoxin [Argonema antarcticum A004/B2]